MEGLKITPKSVSVYKTEINSLFNSLTNAQNNLVKPMVSY